MSDPTIPPGPVPSSVEVRRSPESPPGFVAVVSLVGEHDLATNPEIAAALLVTGGNVLCDLSRCDFIDSSVIGVLVRTSQSLAGAGFELTLVVPPTRHQVRKIIEIVGLGSILPILGELPSIVALADGSAA